MTPGMPLAPDGSGISNCARRCPSVATARKVSLLPRGRGVQIDAVEIVARLFGRDRELRLVDHLLQIGGLQPEAVRHVAGIEIGKSLSGSVCSVKRERPARIVSTPRSPVASSTICEPSGSLRTMS